MTWDSFSTSSALPPRCQQASQPEWTGLSQLVVVGRKLPRLIGQRSFRRLPRHDHSNQALRFHSCAAAWFLTAAHQLLANRRQPRAVLNFITGRRFTVCCSSYKVCGPFTPELGARYRWWSPFLGCTTACSCQWFSRFFRGRS